jgi:hypothetical protein
MSLLCLASGRVVVAVVVAVVVMELLCLNLSEKIIILNVSSSIT